MVQAITSSVWLVTASTSPLGNPVSIRHLHPQQTNLFLVEFVEPGGTLCFILRDRL